MSTEIRRARRSFLWALLCLGLYFLQAVLQGLLRGGSFRLPPETGRFISCFIVLILIGIVLIASKDTLLYKITLKGVNRLKPHMYLVLLCIPFMNLLQIANSPLREVNIFVSIFTGMFVGIIEELIFRGFLLQALMQIQSKQRAIWISSVAFGLFHLFNLGTDPLIDVLLQVIYAAAIGICFACIVIVTKSLVPVIVIHALVDILADYVLAVSWKIDLFAMAVCIALSILMMYKLKS